MPHPESCQRAWLLGVGRRSSRRIGFVHQFVQDGHRQHARRRLHLSAHDRRSDCGSKLGAFTTTGDGGLSLGAELVAADPLGNILLSAHAYWAGYDGRPFIPTAIAADLPIDLYAVDPRLGTLAEYRELSDALHRRHMKLVFDDVPNHVGPQHVWASDPPMPDWFHGTSAHHEENKYVFAPVTDPNAPAAASQDALDGWFVNSLPDMNQQNPAVAKYETQNMIWWIEAGGIDGLRIDTFPYVRRDFWQQYLGELTSLYPHLTSVGEVSIGDATINAYFAGGRTLAGVDTHLTTPFDYPLYHSLLDVLVKGKPMSQLEEGLRLDWLYPHPEALVPFLGNHDQVRFLSQPHATAALLRLGFGLLMTLRGMPELYSGDEIAMLGGEDPDNRRDFPGGFPGDKENAFTAAGRTPARRRCMAGLLVLEASAPRLRRCRPVSSKHC